jgi:hypothetical protein
MVRHESAQYVGLSLCSLERFRSLQSSLLVLVVVAQVWDSGSGRRRSG